LSPVKNEFYTKEGEAFIAYKLMWPELERCDKNPVRGI